jgi:glycosyltransferase involved in cell wall biosynthesis
MKRSITFLLPCRNPTPVGGFKIIYEYANRLANDGFDVNLVYSATLLWSERNLFQKIKGIVAYPTFFIFKTGYLPNSWFKLNKHINIFWVPSPNEKFIPDADFIFATACGTANYVNNYSAKKGKKLYLIQHMEDWDFEYERLIETYKYPLKKIVISQWLKNLIKSIGEPSILIHNGLDFEAFRVTTSQDQRNPRSVLMLYHEAKWKGTDIGLKVFEKLFQIDKKFTLTMFGAFPKPQDLPSYVKYYQSPSQKDLVKLYNKSAVFLGTSFSEGWGLTVAEAMQCGCAVVCTDVNGYNEMAINHQTALLSKSGDYESLYENVIKIIENKSLRLRLSEESNKFIKQFQWEKSYKKLKNLLLED